MTEASPACKQFRSKADDLSKLVEPTNRTVATWLDGRSFSDAFVICIGAGPWKEKRRQAVQGTALLALNNRDLSEVTEQVDWYPLSWENRAIVVMAAYLQEANRTMDFFCAGLKRVAKRESLMARMQFYEAAGSPNGTKVLALFCRDVLHIPSFPIDRHVKRNLVKLGLPVHEDAMVKLCAAKCFDACEVARAMVISANPDWSKQLC